MPREWKQFGPTPLTMDPFPDSIGGVFGLVGGLILVFSLYLLVTSLEVRQVGNDMVNIRRVLGSGIATRTMNRNGIVRN